MAAPIRRGDGARHAIAVAFTPALLDGALSRDTIRKGHIVALLDRNDVVIWRNVAPDRFVGRPATPDLRAVIGRLPEGVMKSVSLEGVPTLVAYSRSAVSGWTFVVAVPQREIAGPRQRAAGLGLLAAAGLLLTAAALGLLAGKRLARAVGRLSDAADRYRSREAAAREERKANHERLLLVQEVGVLDRLFAALAQEADLEWVSIDSTSIRAQAQASGAARKKGALRPGVLAARGGPRDQDTRLRRRPWPARQLRPDAWPPRRRHPGRRFARRPQARRRHRR